MTTLYDWLADRPFTLGMSSGFFGFYAHAGFVGALDHAQLLPARLTGSSAGALVAGLWAAGVDVASMTQELLALRRHDFWDPAPGLGLLRGELFAARLRALLPVERFAECRVPLAVSVFDLGTLGTRVVDRGPLAPAIQASCTFPFLFQPQRVAGRPSLDGGVLDRPGLDSVRPAERLFHHHLASRSPWRRRHSPALAVPERAHTTTLVVHGLPRLGPFRLTRGADAIARAREATLRALEAPLDGASDLFSIHASQSTKSSAPMASSAASRPTKRR
jgi:NTE family protein